jgi:hypothetical protein
MFYNQKNMLFLYISLSLKTLKTFYFHMPMVYILCPTTGNLVQTNYILPDVKKLQERIERNIPINCHYCNDVHIWNDDNGFFLGADAKKKTT